MSSIYNCPHCGKKSFNPWKKAMAGQLNSPGKVCMECGQKCVNGRGATIFNAVFSVICLALVVFIYLKSQSFWGTEFEWIAFYEVPFLVGVILLKFIVPRLVNAFFFRLEPAIRIDSVK